MSSTFCTAPTLLCPVDFSSNSNQAIGTAIALARAAQGRVVLLHVIDLCGVRSGREAFTDQDMRELQSQMAELADDEPDLAIERWLETGEPSRTIVRLAAECGIDLIVIGTRGAHAVARPAEVGKVRGCESRGLASSSTVPPTALRPGEPTPRESSTSGGCLGSVAAEVLRKATCCVMTVGGLPHENRSLLRVPTPRPKS